MLRHLVFADCALLATDVRTRDLFVGMSYGLYPFCVGEDRDGLHLVFRRIARPGEGREKQRRLADAVEALAALPAVRRYHAGLADGNEELHVDPAALSVLWPIDRPREVHLAVVPALTAWTRWDGDDAWYGLRAGLVAGGGAPPPYSGLPRHLKLARVLEFVAERRPLDAALSQRLVHLATLNRLRLQLDPETGQLADVSGYDGDDN